MIGARSLVIIMICGFFVGMVLALQAINALQQFGAADQVSLLVGNEAGPYSLLDGLGGGAFADAVQADDAAPSSQLRVAEINGRLVQPVRIANADQAPVIALYFMEQQPDSSWKTDGCILVEEVGQEI